MIALLKRYALPLVGGLSFLLVLLVVMAFPRGEGAAKEAFRAKGGQVVAQAGKNVSQAAVEAVASQGDKEAAVVAMDQENRHAILPNLRPRLAPALLATLACAARAGGRVSRPSPLR